MKEPDCQIFGVNEGQQVGMALGSIAFGFPLRDFTKPDIPLTVHALPVYMRA